jgi:nucleotide-binding universal stress UspA family protein
MPANSSDKPTPDTVIQLRGKGAEKRLRLLAVVDGTELTNRIVDFIISFGEGRPVTEVVILNVQSKRADARLRGYQTFKEAEVNDRLLNEVGLPIVNSVSKKLQAAGITCLSKVAIGDPLSVISSCAAENGCDLILVGKRTRTGVGRVIPGLLRMWLESRTALQLVVLAPTSVVVVK